MAPIPEKREDLIALGWEFTGEGRCRACGEYIEWWATANGKRMPMSVIDVKDETKVFPQPILYTARRSHFANCPNANEFRRGK